MSTSRHSCCLPSVKKQKHDFQAFAFVQCIIKQLLDSVFVISRIIKVEVRVISRSRRLRLITLTSTLIILDITKTSSNNCLLFTVITVVPIWVPDFLKCTVNAKFTNIMDIGLLRVSEISTGSVYHRNFFGLPKTLRFRWMF